MLAGSAPWWPYLEVPVREVPCLSPGVWREEFSRFLPACTGS